MNDIERALKRPFKRNELRSRTQGGKKLVYITARSAMDRLDEVFGPEGWKQEYFRLGDAVMCTVSCFIKGQWVSKTDGVGETNIEAEKGGISDAFKRACVGWGIGRYLYNPAAFPDGLDGPPAHWATQKGYDEIWAERDAQGIEQFREDLGKAA